MRGTCLISIWIAIGTASAGFGVATARAGEAPATAPFTGEGWEDAVDAPEMIEAFGVVRDAIDALTKSGEDGSCAKDGEGIGPSPGPCKLPAPECRIFFDYDCSLGSLGAAARMDLSRNVTNRSDAKSGKSSGFVGHFIANPPIDIALVCPKYGRFDVYAKANFWVWVAMQLAYEESGCGLDMKNESNRKAVGLFQLDRDESARSGLRPVECTDAFIAINYPKQTIRDHEPNLRCALAMLSVQLSRPRTAVAETREDIAPLSSGRLVTRSSYWQELRNVGKRLLSGIKSFPGCQ